MKPEGIGISKELQETLQSFSRAYVDSITQIQVNIQPMFAAIKTIGETVSAIKFPVIEIPKIQIELPKFNFSAFPQIDWEEFYADFSEECSSNAKFGWCISAEMSFSDYRRIGRAEETQEVRDTLFTELFESNNFSLYEEEKKSIVFESKDGWGDFYSECFQSVEDGRIKVSVPSLLMAIEYELNIIINTDAVGKGLVRAVQSSIEQNKDPRSISYIMSVSLFSLLENGIFEKGITGPRPQLINRNRILHGRDDSLKWTRTDIYRLVSIISAIKMFQNNS